MAKTFCSKMSALSRESMHPVTRPALLWATQCIKGMCNRSNRAVSHQSHQRTASMQNMISCPAASPLILRLSPTTGARVYSMNSPSNLFLSRTCYSNNTLTNSVICRKHTHTCKLDFNSDTEFVSNNVSPEVSEIQQQAAADQELPATKSEDEFSLDAIISEESEDELDILATRKDPRVIEEFAEPPLMPSSYTLASYVEQSEVLQKLMQLGVDLSKVEKRRGVGERILKMNFDPDITEKISFLHFVGVESDNLGKFLTKNPHILLEDQDNLEKRVKYLMSKKFDQSAVAQIVNRAPYFLCFSVERLDDRLGFYQQTFQLTGDELRQIITTCPKLVTQSLERTKENVFVLKKQFGFYNEEVKSLVVNHPRILTRGKYKLITVFDYLHNDMGIPHKLILKNVQVFNSRAFQIQERHKFLESLGRVQYNPNDAGYVSLKKLTKLPDEEFCQEIAKSNIEEYNYFLKTL